MHAAPHIKQMIRATKILRTLRQSDNQRTRKPKALDYNVEDGGSAYKYSDYKDREQEYNLLFDHFILQGGFDAGV
jgi:hypothetical protein